MNEWIDHRLFSAKVRGSLPCIYIWTFFWSLRFVNDKIAMNKICTRFFFVSLFSLRQQRLGNISSKCIRLPQELSWVRFRAFAVEQLRCTPESFNVSFVCERLMHAELVWQPQIRSAPFSAMLIPNCCNCWLRVRKTRLGNTASCTA